MSGIAWSPALVSAIQLRQWTRDAIDRGDDREMVRLNRLADRAYAALDGLDAKIYGDWAFDRERFADLSSNPFARLADYNAETSS